MYKVYMTFSAVKDDWKYGETDEYGANWDLSQEFATLPEVKEFVKENTYSGYEYIEYDEYLKRYTTSYMTTDENEGEMTDLEHEQWKQGDISGWSVQCDITVKKYTPKLIGNIKFNNLTTKGSK